MIQSELIEKISEKNPLFKNAMIDCIKATENKMVSHLAQGGRIEIRGFGSFKLHYHKKRLARNPKTGEKLTTPSKYAVHFKPGKALKKRINAQFQTNKQKKKKK
jgi:integration host factor subunit beta